MSSGIGNKNLDIFRYLLYDFHVRHRSDAWLSLVERYVRDVEVAGSNPVASIKKHGYFLSMLFIIKLVGYNLGERNIGGIIHDRKNNHFKNGILPSRKD